MWPTDDERKERDIDYASVDADRLAADVLQLVNEAQGESWYLQHGNPIDLAVARLCLLRRARAGAARGTTGGDDAVRRVLSEAEPDALVWLASRAISYMDEQGFPELVPGARLASLED
jgi:hypothetical protein